MYYQTNMHHLYYLYNLYHLLIFFTIFVIITLQVIEKCEFFWSGNIRINIVSSLTQLI